MKISKEGIQETKLRLQIAKLQMKVLCNSKLTYSIFSVLQKKGLITREEVNEEMMKDKYSSIDKEIKETEDIIKFLNKSKKLFEEDSDKNFTNKYRLMNSLEKYADLTDIKEKFKSNMEDKNNGW